MPRSSDPKLDVRFSSPGLAAIRAAAESIGVAPGTLVRECAERYGPLLAREVSEGRVSLARRSAPVPAVTGPPATGERPAAPPVPQGVERAELFRNFQERRAVR